MKSSKPKKNKIKELVYEVSKYLIPTEEGKRIIDLLYNKKDVNEFLISKKIGLTINQVRNLLYKLASKNLVSAIRKRDKKKGWYIYFWTLHPDRCIEALKGFKEKKLDEIEHGIRSKINLTFYSCSNNCLVMKEETALLHDFFCPECGELTMPISMEKEIKKLNAEKEKIKKEIKELDELIIKFRKPIERKKEKREKIKKKGKTKKNIKEKKKIVKKLKGKVTPKVKVTVKVTPKTMKFKKQKIKIKISKTKRLAKIKAKIRKLKQKVRKKKKR